MFYKLNNDIYFEFVLCTYFLVIKDLFLKEKNASF